MPPVRPRLALASRPSLYIFIVVGALLVVCYYRLRTDSVFACPAVGYSTDGYLAYCQSKGYGDFDHGAFWFDLEPAATKSAAAADVLFVGNSRMQYGFSNAVAEKWLAENTPSYYLLGFGYYDNAAFERALLKKIEPHPRIYIINLDYFFEDTLSVPANIVMNEPSALTHYRSKYLWQGVHGILCDRTPWLCGNSYAIFRSRNTGVWHSFGEIGQNMRVSVDPKLDSDAVTREIASGRQFLDTLPAKPECVLFTLVPTVDTPSATSGAIASALHVEFIAPQVKGLETFDGSHLKRASAEEWSKAFFEAAGPKIRSCVQGESLAATVAGK